MRGVVLDPTLRMGEGIEQAMDSSDPKSALIELILSSPDVNSSATGPVVPEGVPPS